MDQASRSTTAPPSQTLKGYHGCYLRIDLSQGDSRTCAVGEEVLRRFLGGSGLGAYLLLKEQAAVIEPLSPEAAIAFVFSPLVGSPLTTSAKFAVVSKSPLTQRFNDSLVSSGFALGGKRTGCDALVLTGRAAAPSLLVIDNGRVRLLPAGELWGTTCSQAQLALKKRFDPDYQIAVIGPAGERQVRYATISHDGRHAGRGGNGAVLGAKNIKAVLVRGNQRCPWDRPAELVALSKALSARSLGPATAKYRELGTASNLLALNRLNTLPTRNFQQGSFAGAAKLSPEALAETREKTRASCAACTIGCEHLYALAPANRHDHSAVRLEYENLFALGPLCGVEDADAVLAASHRCDELGLDTISTGGTIAFAMECAQRGLMDAPWLRFGDGDALQQAIELIAARKGLGGALAEGSRLLAERVGHNSIAFAPQVKGLEMPGYEPRGLQTMALGLAVGSRGADHNRSGAYEIDFSERVDRRRLVPATAELAIETEDRAALLDSLILCRFLRGVFTDLFEEAAEMLNLVTGWDTTAEELRTCAARVVAARKLFNIRAGWQPLEDTLPDRFLAQPPSDDPAACLSRERLAQAVRVYNQRRGWTEAGWIEDQRLEELGLAEL